MNLQRIAAVVLRQYYLLRGSVTRLLPLFVWVVIDMVLWGFISRYLGSMGQGGLNFTTLLLGAVLLWDFLTRVMHGVTMAFFEDVWSRNFLNMFAAPLSVQEYITGLVLTSICTSAFGLAAMLVVAQGVFGLSLTAYGTLLVPALATLFLFGIALGVLGCATVLRLGPAAEWLIWSVPALLSPFACVFYPLATLPEWMQGVSYLMPAMYVFESLRASSPDTGLMAGLTMAVLYVVVACFIFVRVYRHALRSGLIARYSAETIS